MKTFSNYLNESKLSWQDGKKLAYKYWSKEFPGGVKGMLKFLKELDGPAVENSLEGIFWRAGEENAIILWLNKEHGFDL